MNAGSLNSFEICTDTLPKVQVRYFGTIRLATHKSEEKMEIASNTTVYRLLQGLVNAYGDGFRGEIFQESGEMLREDLMVTVNEVLVKHTSVDEINLKPADVVALYPIFPGGG